jgi:hypothetical protein
MVLDGSVHIELHTVRLTCLAAQPGRVIRELLQQLELMDGWYLVPAPTPRFMRTPIEPLHQNGEIFS